MRLIDANELIKKRWQVKQVMNQPDLYIIGQGFVMDAPTIELSKGLSMIIVKSNFHDYENRLSEETKKRIEEYRKTKENNIFDLFYNAHLDFMEKCIEFYMLNMQLDKTLNDNSNENEK